MTRFNRIMLAITSILVLGAITIVALMLWAIKNCYPLYIGFDFKMQNADAGNSNQIIVNTEPSSGDDDMLGVWQEQDPATFIDQKKVEVWTVQNSIVQLKIVADYALCDANDSYTNLDPKKINLSINGEKEKIDSNYKIFTQDISPNTEGERIFEIKLDYNGEFQTERSITVHWLSEDEFRQKQSNTNPS